MIPNPVLAGLLDSLRDHPDDPVSRLVLADWLDEHGDPLRAEILRINVRLAGTPADTPDRSRLVARDLELRQTLGPDLLGPRPESLKDYATRDGLVDSLSFAPYACLADIEPLMLRHPVRHLSLVAGPVLLELARSPLAGSLRSLRIDSGFVPRRTHRETTGLDRFLGSPWLCNLSALTIYGNAFDNYLARLLATAPHLQGLRAHLQQHLHRRCRHPRSASARCPSPARRVACRGGQRQFGCLSQSLPSRTALASHLASHPARPGTARSAHASRHPDLPRSVCRLGRTQTALVRLDRFGGLPSAHSVDRALPALHTLVLDGWLDASIATQLAETPELKQLRRLEIAMGSATHEVRQEVRRILMESPYLHPATRLGVTGT